MRKFFMGFFAPSFAVLGVCSMASAELAPKLVRSNVEMCDGTSASGFKLIGSEVTPFVMAKYEGACFVADDVVFVPASVDVYDLDDVRAYLKSIGVIHFDPVMRARGGGKRLSESDLNGNGELDDFVVRADRYHW